MTVGSGISKTHGEAARLETEAGVNAAPLRQDSFCSKASVLFLQLSGQGLPCDGG